MDVGASTAVGRRLLSVKYRVKPMVMCGNCAQSETREDFLLALPFSPVSYDSINVAVSKVCVADPSGSETTAQRIRFLHFRNGYF